MSKRPRSGSDSMAVPGEAKRGKAPGASGEMAEHDTGVENESDRLALDSSTEQSPEELSMLGWTHLEQFRRWGRLNDLEKSLEYSSHALALTPDGHPKMSHRHANLGVSYRDRFQRLGELADLEKAIECHSHALALTPDGHPEMSHRHANLGVSYRDRFQRLGELADLEKAIECHSHALALTPEGHPNMSHRHANLGVSYTDRFQRLGELADLEKAIESLECDSHALALTPDGHPNMSHRHANLGVSYRHRFQHLGELADLEKAIECHSHALALTPDGHPDMSHRHASLGVSYSDRFQRLGELVDLEKAIECKSHALTLTPDGHPDMSHRHASLGVSYNDRFRRLGELADLEKAIECKSHALALTPDGHPNMSDRHASLGVSYSDRFQRLGELADLEKALECDSHALALTPDGHPPYIQPFSLASFLALFFQSFSGLGLFLLYQHTSNPSHLHHSLDSFCKASQSLTGSPRDKFWYALQWANLASKQSLLNPMEAYQTTINLLPQFIWLGATANQRYQDLSTTENLAVNACFAAIQSSNFPLALEWLEHTRCVVWNQSLALRTPLDQLHSSHPDLATRLQTIANQLHSSSFDTGTIQQTSSEHITPEQVGQQRRRLAVEYNDMLPKIRQLPGFEAFLQPMKADRLIRVARGGPIVVINCHTDRCDALFILPGHEEITHLPLPNFTEDKARQTRSELGSLLRQKGLRRPMPQTDYEDGIESVLRILWTDIVKPVLDHLGYVDVLPMEHLPHVTWCPTGPLSFLPLHAAGDYSQPSSQIFDYVISSYIPTLTALSPTTPSSLDRKCRVLAIGQATTPGQSPLPGTIVELAHVKHHTHEKAEYLQLIDNEATTVAVLDAMEQHDWVHLACHAHQNPNEPTKSGFYLHDDTLDLMSINRRSFKNKGLAFLSACQTATGDEMLPDEAIHLASGMLMAGYPSVIAMMWSVGDDDAPLVADKVYAQLMKDGKVGNREAGRALHYAVAALREQVGEKAFARWVPYIHIGS
ncbi:hypothetical protein RSAG8_07394, partial [Rhizoctonia solani AG-8 WAC10335]